VVHSNAFWLHSGVVTAESKLAGLRGVEKIDPKNIQQGFLGCVNT